MCSLFLFFFWGAKLKRPYGAKAYDPMITTSSINGGRQLAYPFSCGPFKGQNDMQNRFLADKLFFLQCCDLKGEDLASVPLPVYILQPRRMTGRLAAQLR